MEIWQRSFTNHRIRDGNDFEKHKRYIHLNPVRADWLNLLRIIRIRPRIPESWSMRRHSG